jgi:hypothetical protein
MHASIYRPPMEGVSLHLFRRPLHPELFETLATRVVRKDDYTLTVRITPAGHVLTWHTPDVTLTEMTASRSQELPERGHVWRHRLRGEHSDAFRASAVVSYQMNTHTEVLPEELFLRLHEELLSDGKKRGFLHLFHPAHRFALTPLGYVTADARAGCLVVNTFHTFPEESAIIRTQTLIERV